MSIDNLKEDFAVEKEERKWKDSFRSWLENMKILSSEEDKLDQELIQARTEWMTAKKYFNSVSDPDLIDYAIYLIEAAEAKYSFLLKKKKRRQARMDT
ncbi:MAG: DUF2508 family protein [Halanaerobium sp.]|nr:DUF2508 family protein [Halanaerobium sp.]